MNEIERKYFEAFNNFNKQQSIISVSFPDKNAYFGNVECYLNASSIDQAGDDIDYTEDFIAFEFLYKSKNFEKKCPNIFNNGVLESMFLLKPGNEEICGYKPDFIITSENFANLNFVIEIDGHEWHEKTKEQASYDRRKDRTYQKSLYIPIRFTGTDVYHDAQSCVRDTMEIVFTNVLYHYFLMNC